MATVNQRTRIVQASVINGVDAGGAMSARIEAGFDNIMQSAPDGAEVAFSDREVQFVRGTVVTQDWIHFVDLLTGTVGTYVCYERKSGVAEATGYIKHTITNPVIHNVRMDLTKGQYGTITFLFECKAADETKTIADMWGLLDDQAAPSYISAARGGYRAQTTVFDPTPGDNISIYHVMSLTFTIAMNLVRECNDADVAYTCVDAGMDGIVPTGSITFQDSSIVTAQLLAQRLVQHAADTLEITITQGQGATAKKITIAGVAFDSGAGNADVTRPFTDYTLPFRVVNSAGTPLTLTGTNKIITIADAA